MSENENPQSGNEKARPKGAKRSSAAGLAFLALLVALASLGFSAQQWWAEHRSGATDAWQPPLNRLQAQQTDFTGELEALRTTLDDIQQRLSRATAQNTAADPARLQGLDARLERITRSDRAARDQIASLQLSLENAERRLDNMDALMRSDGYAVSSSSLQSALLELRFELELSNFALSRYDGRERAMLSIRTAEQLLAGFADPALDGLRLRLQRDREAILAIQLPDRQAIRERMTDLVDSVADWPIVAAAEPEADQPSERNWRDKLGNALKAVVKVRREDDGSEIGISPQHEEILRQFMREQLSIAGLLAGSRDFWPHLDRIRQDFPAYFDAAAAPVKDALDAIDRLLDQRPAGPLPDLSRSLQALEDLSRRLESSAAPAGRRKAEDAPVSGDDVSPMDDSGGSADTGNSADMAETAAANPGSADEAAMENGDGQ